MSYKFDENGNIVDLPMGLHFQKDRGGAIVIRWQEKNASGDSVRRSASYAINKYGLTNAIEMALAKRKLMLIKHGTKLRTYTATRAKRVVGTICDTLSVGVTYNKLKNNITVSYTEFNGNVNIHKTKYFSIKQHGYDVAVKLATQWRETHHQPNSERIKITDNDDLPVGVISFFSNNGVLQYRALWMEYDEEKKRCQKTKTFSVSKYGKDEAKRLAIAYRKKMLILHPI